jgi:hypothetical protein
VAEDHSTRAIRKCYSRVQKDLFPVSFTKCGHHPIVRILIGIFGIGIAAMTNVRMWDVTFRTFLLLVKGLIEKIRMERLCCRSHQAEGAG